jgi:hypothetical protein
VRRQRGDDRVGGARRLERGERAGDDLDAAASLEASGLPIG